MTIGLSEQGMVLAAPDVLAWMELGSSLTNQDVTRGNQLAAVFLDAQPFGF
jgi:hypothetical protein